jgi:hypothetical protein
MDYTRQLGYTSSSIAARVCCSVFGRDEVGLRMVDLRLHVDHDTGWMFCAWNVAHMAKRGFH